MVTRVIKFAVQLALLVVHLSRKSMALATRCISGPILKELYKTDDTSTIFFLIDNSAQHHSFALDTMKLSHSNDVIFQKCNKCHHKKLNIIKHLLQYKLIIIIFLDQRSLRL